MRKLGLKVVGRVKSEEDLRLQYSNLYDAYGLEKLPFGKDVELKWHEDWQGYQIVGGDCVSFNDFSHIDLICADFVIRMKVKDLEVSFTTIETCDLGFYARHEKSGFLITADEESGFMVDSKGLSLQEKGDVCNFRFESERRMFKWVKRLSKCKVWEDN